jgi:hypothetical protein
MKKDAITWLSDSWCGEIAKPFICRAGTAGTVPGHFFSRLIMLFIRCMFNSQESSRCILKHSFMYLM